MRFFWLVPLLLFTTLLGACGPDVYLSDDIQIDLRLSLVGKRTDSLHTPYVPGTHVRIYVHTQGEDRAMDGWSLESSAPGVLRVEKQRYDDHRLSADCVTVAEGRADLVVRNGRGVELGRSSIVVEQPDRAELTPHGPLILGEKAAAAREAQVLSSGSATFLVEYFRGDHRVYGNTILQTAVDSGDPQALLARPRSTFLLINREWLTVTAAPNTSGNVTLALLANGRKVGTFGVQIKNEADIRRVDLRGEDESRAQKGETLSLLAQAYDEKNQVIYGATFRFMLQGVIQSGEDTGDLFRYTYDPEQPRMLTVTHGSFQASALLHTGMGYVSSTNFIGCAMGHATKPSSLLGFFLVLLTLALPLVLVRLRFRRRATM